METRPLSDDAPTLPTWAVLAQHPVDLEPQEISSLLAGCGEVAAEELELIEMRYQRAMALKNIEGLFAEGQLDCM
jgi:hypothetical protein